MSLLLPLQGDHMDRLFTICYLPMCLLLLVVMMHYGPGVADPHTRITAGYVGFIAVTILMPVVRSGGHLI